jgi:hypothetical protein
MHQTISRTTFIKLVESGMSLRKIANKYGYADASGLYARCHRLGLTLPPSEPHSRKRTKTFDTRFFHTLDTEVKAYTLGFIAADGGLDRKWGVKISLHPRDAEILRQMAKAMSCSWKPVPVENGSRIKLALYDIDMVADLSKYGIVARKTYTLPFAQNVPDAMLRHYVRGVFDGDGSVGKQVRLVTGSKPFFDGFMVWYTERYNKVPWTACEGGTKWRLVFNKRDAEFVHWMYANNRMCLSRKFDGYMRYWM